MDLLGLAFNFLRLCRTSFELSVVDRISAFCDLGRDLLLLLLNPYHIISAVTAVQTTAQLGALWSVLLPVSLVGV